MATLNLNVAGYAENLLSKNNVDFFKTLNDYWV
jgi:hypothetical protein